jgi:hypothetical protein
MGKEFGMATRLEWGLVPHPLPIGFGTAGQTPPVLATRRGIPRDLIQEWWAELSRNGLGEFPKAEPRFVR